MRGQKQEPEVVMSYSQSPPLAEGEWFTDPVSPDAPARNSDARSDRRSVAQPRPTAVRPPRSFGRKGLHEGADRPSVAGRVVRGVFRFLLAVAIGVGATLGAQTDTAKEMLAANAPTLAWVLSVSPTKPLGVAAPAQQTDPFIVALASNVDAVRRSVEQLAFKQEQMAQSMAALQTAEEDVRQRMSSPPPSPPREAAVAQPRPALRAPSAAAQPASVPRPAPVAPSALPSR
jgi:hypothetical protein